MLTVREAIQKRRSIRSFNQTPVPDEMIFEMLEAARLAPSGSNAQPWRFVVVTDAEEKKELRKLCFDQAFVEEAGVLFVFCTDLSVYSGRTRQTRMQEMINAGVFADRELDDSRTQRYIEMPDESDTAFYLPMATANTYIAVEHIVLTATALGLGSCWVGGISDLKAIRDMLGIPRGIFVHGLVAVGYTDTEPKARPRLPLDEMLLRPFPSSVGSPH
ncbi:MAG: nitroreductase family protein [Dehalococcoidales bacterium]|nr:MAG: nitroreductase family protein [Dehalococcoidales bacterium]